MAARSRVLPDGLRQCDLTSQPRFAPLSFFDLIHSRMGAEDRARMLGMVRGDPLTRRSGHDRAKKTAGRATVSHLREHLDHLDWLDGVGGSTDAWVRDVPTAKTTQFAAEARALDAAEMSDFAPVKLIVLEACLLHQTRIRASDDLVTMLCKRMNTLHNKAKELLETIREEQRERNERMLEWWCPVPLDLSHEQTPSARLTCDGADTVATGRGPAVPGLPADLSHLLVLCPPANQR
jgi:hypothetical protein